MEAAVGDPAMTVLWHYPDKVVRLHFFRCAIAGEPAPLEGQEMRWVTAADMSSYSFPEADKGLVAWLTRRR